MTTFQLRGDANNPYHVSIGGAVRDGNKIALVEKQDGTFTLPRETIYSNESLIDCLRRGIREELGLEITPTRYLGSLTTTFNRPDGTLVEKTTLYFEVNRTQSLDNKSPEIDEESDEIRWVEIDKAKQILMNQKNPESKILDRISS